MFQSDNIRWREPQEYKSALQHGCLRISVLVQGGTAAAVVLVVIAFIGSLSCQFFSCALQPQQYDAIW